MSRTLLQNAPRTPLLLDRSEKSLERNQRMKREDALGQLIDPRLFALQGIPPSGAAAVWSRSSTRSVGSGFLSSPVRTAVAPARPQAAAAAPPAGHESRNLESRGPAGPAAPGTTPPDGCTSAVPTGSTAVGGVVSGAYASPRFFARASGFEVGGSGRDTALRARRRSGWEGHPEGCSRRSAARALQPGRFARSSATWASIASQSSLQGPSADMRSSAASSAARAASGAMIP